MQGYKNSKIANIQSTLLVIMHLSICTPTPPPGTTWGNSGAFTSVLTILWSPGVGYLIREQTRATCRLYRLCAVFQTPGHRPIASVLLQAPENKKARESRSYIVVC